MCVRAGWIPLSWRFTWFLHCFWTNSYEHLQNLPNLFTILPKPPRLCCQVLRAVVRDLLDMGALDGRCDPSFAHGSSLTRGRRPLWDRSCDKSNPLHPLLHATPPNHSAQVRLLLPAPVFGRSVSQHVCALTADVVSFCDCDSRWFCT